jgi:hypothetical protein
MSDIQALLRSADAYGLHSISLVKRLGTWDAYVTTPRAAEALGPNGESTEHDPLLALTSALDAAIAAAKIREDELRKRRIAASSAFSMFEDVL